jgi:hypothetical protein
MLYRCNWKLIPPYNVVKPVCRRIRNMFKMIFSFTGK